MTPEEQSTINQKLREIAEILYNNTSDDKLATFETIELGVATANGQKTTLDV